MLQPKKSKFRKYQRGRNKGIARRGAKVSFGEYGLQSLENCTINGKQLEAARKAVTHEVSRGGKIWIRIFPDHVITARPADTRMGKGKGAPVDWVAKVQTGKIIFEMAGVDSKTAEEAMCLAAHKLPCKTRFVDKSRG